MHLFKLTDEQITQLLIPKRFVPPTPPEHEGKNMLSCRPKFYWHCQLNFGFVPHSAVNAEVHRLQTEAARVG